MNENITAFNPFAVLLAIDHLPKEPCEIAVRKLAFKAFRYLLGVDGRSMFMSLHGKFLGFEEEPDGMKRVAHALDCGLTAKGKFCQVAFLAITLRLFRIDAVILHQLGKGQIVLPTG